MENIYLKKEANQNCTNDCHNPIILSHSKKTGRVNSLAWNTKSVCVWTGHLFIINNLLLINRMNGEHRYNIPMFGVKHWYEHEMEAVGHLASMDDAYLRRMYASKVVSGMNHLTRAIEEKINDPGYEHKKRDLELMRDGVKRTMEHLKKDYDVTEDNISYKWNTAANKNKNKNNTTMPTSITMPSSFEPSMNRLSFNENTLPSFNEDTLSLNEDEDMPILTLNNMKNFSTAKTGNSNLLNLNKKNTLNLGTIPLNLNKKNTLNVNNNMLNLNKTTLNTNNKNVLSLNNKNATVNANVNANANKNKNKNTLVGGRRRKNRKGRHTRRN